MLNDAGADMASDKRRQRHTSAEWHTHTHTHTPKGPSTRPRGSFKGPRGPFEGPRDVFKGPRGPLKGPGDPLTRPRGPFKGRESSIELFGRPVTVTVTKGLLAGYGTPAQAHNLGTGH